MHLSADKTALPVIILAAMMSVPSANFAAPTLTLAEQEVIDALLSPRDGMKESKMCVITEYTSIRMLGSGQDTLELANAYNSFSNSFREQAKDRDKAFREALDDFLAKNRTPVSIAFPTNAPKGVELVSGATVNGIFSVKNNAKRSGWDVFYRQFPGSTGLITISRAGIDSKGTVAIIYLGQQGGYRAGRGGIRILRRERGKWILKVNEKFGPEWNS